jgi:hypothetical protein
MLESQLIAINMQWTDYGLPLYYHHQQSTIIVCINSVCFMLLACARIPSISMRPSRSICANDIQLLTRPPFCVTRWLSGTRSNNAGNYDNTQISHDAGIEVMDDTYTIGSILSASSSPLLRHITFEFNICTN